MLITGKQPNKMQHKQLSFICPFFFPLFWLQMERICTLAFYFSHKSVLVFKAQVTINSVKWLSLVVCAEYVFAEVISPILTKYQPLQNLFEVATLFEIILHSMITYHYHCYRFNVSFWYYFTFGYFFENRKIASLFRILLGKYYIPHIGLMYNKERMK